MVIKSSRRTFSMLIDVVTFLLCQMLDVTLLFVCIYRYTGIDVRTPADGSYSDVKPRGVIGQHHLTEKSQVHISAPSVNHAYIKRGSGCPLLRVSVDRDPTAILLPEQSVNFYWIPVVIDVDATVGGEEGFEGIVAQGVGV